MSKPLIQLFIALLFCSSLHAQETVADSIPVNKDSIERELDSFLRLYDSLQSPKSYLLVAAGFGNTQFSVKNIALNSQQSSNNLSIIPTIGYYDKNGISISYNNYLLQEGKSLQLLQHSLTLAYDFPKAKNVAYGFSYTRFLGKKEFVNSSSPYDNDLLVYVNKRKGLFQPGVMIGYSSGRYRETSRYLDSQRVFNPVPTYIYFYVNDTSRVSVKAFSFIPYLQYEFEWKGFSKKDYLTFRPTFMLIGGTNKLTVDSKGRRSILKYPRFGRAYDQSSSQASEFKIQSIGLSLDAVWYIGKFYINPQLYIDDYLLSSKNKFNFLYTMQVGFMIQ